MRLQFEGSHGWLAPFSSLPVTARVSLCVALLPIAPVRSYSGHHWSHSGDSGLFSERLTNLGPFFMTACDATGDNPAADCSAAGCSAAPDI